MMKLMDLMIITSEEDQNHFAYLPQTYLRKMILEGSFLLVHYLIYKEVRFHLLLEYLVFMVSTLAFKYRWVP